MTQNELEQIVDRQMSNPAVLGAMACNLRDNRGFAEQHRDHLTMHVQWHDVGGIWNCEIVSDEQSKRCVAYIRLHDNATVRVDAFVSCRITVSPDEGTLCLTRLS